MKSHCLIKYLLSFRVKINLSGGLDGKDSACNTENPGSIPGKTPGEEMATHPSILAWKSHGWRSLVGYSPWDHKELDTTEWLIHTTYLIFMCVFPEQTYWSISLVLICQICLYCSILAAQMRIIIQNHWYINLVNDLINNYWITMMLMN